MRTPDKYVQQAIEGVKLLHAEEDECHALAGREYAVLYIMAKNGQQRIFDASSSFYCRIPDWTPVLWIDTFCDERTPAEVAGELLNGGRFPRATDLLTAIAGQGVSK